MLFLVNIFTQCSGKLIGTGRALEAATDSRETLDRLLDVHADQQCRNALCVACASAVKAYALNDIVFNVDFNRAGANALRAINNVFHKFGILSLIN